MFIARAAGFPLFTQFYAVERGIKGGEFMRPCDPGEIRTLNQQNRNLSFYPLNYGTNHCKSITKRPVLQLISEVSETRAQIA
jgi:hypothetical protein